MQATLAQRDHLDGLVRDFRTAMLVTHGTEGQLRARPMSVAAVEDSGDLWFSTGISSTKADEMLTDARVAVVMQDASRFVCVSGEAELIVNREKAAELWNEAWRPWFPGGPNDPEFALVHVRSKRAEFWDISGVGGALYVLNAARHAATGTRLDDGNAKHHAKVELPRSPTAQVAAAHPASLVGWMKAFLSPHQRQT